MDLVTGGTGFLGSHLLYHLMNKGTRVRAIKRKDSNFKLISRIFSFYGVSFEALQNKIEWVEADLNDVYSISDCLEGVHDVYHTAAKVSFLPGDRGEMMLVNIEGTANLVNMALEKKIRKFIHVSSIAALGRGEISNVINEDVVWKASKRNSNYAISKYGGEREVWRGIEEGLDAVIVNPSIILGPGEISSGSARLIQTVDKGLKFYTKGINGFVDVRDVVKIMIRLMESEITGKRFVVSAENLSYKTLFGFIAHELKKPPPNQMAARWMGELAWRYYYLRMLLNGKTPLITRETADTANNKYLYSSDKIIGQFGYEFIPISKTLYDACQFHLKKGD